MEDYLDLLKDLKVFTIHLEQLTAQLQYQLHLEWQLQEILDDRNNNVIAVIGDGAMSAGMAYEAMNNAGSIKSRLIVILNDNDMSIAPPVGAMRSYLAKLLSGKTYIGFRGFLKKIALSISKIDKN